MTYPNPYAPAGFIECPVHHEAVAVDDHGRITSTCTSCLTDAVRARSWMKKEAKVAA